MLLINGINMNSQGKFRLLFRPKNRGIKSKEIQ
jgi:hypothetical protein